LVVDGPTSYSYTLAGERQSKTVNGQTILYRADAFGNLLGAMLPDGTTITYP
jgi:hypothetical protein